jgi:hypothetical protein
MLRVTTLLLLLAVLRPPSAALAQDPRLAARLDSATHAQVESVIAGARADGLPAEPLVQKALEGASKGAAGPRIVAAVASTLADLRRAREALGANASADDIVATAAALRAGATPTMVSEMRRVDPHAGLAVPLGVFTDLVAGGVPVGAAWRSVAELAERGGDAQEFLDLRDRLRPPVESP